MKAGWQKKKLHEVCELVNGRAYSKPELLTQGKYRVLRVGNFFTNDHWYYSDLELDEKKYCDTGDLLYAWSASFGPRIWSGEKVIYHYHIWKVLPDYTLIDKKFLFLWFLWDTEQIKEDHGAGTTMIHVSKGSMDDRDILLPPLPEQQRIVGILDDAFDGIATAKANAEQNLQNARALFESHLQSVFTQRGEGWMVRSLEDVVDANCTLSYGIVQPGSEVEDGLPVVRPTDLTSKLITLDGLKRIDPKLADGYRRTTLRGGELLLCVRGSTGIISVTAPELAGANVTRGIVPIVFNPSLLSQDFGYFMMISEAIQSQIREKTYGAALMQINIGDLRKVVVSFPSMLEQKKMAAKLEELAEETQRLESLYQRKLAALDELKKSLLHQAFSGAL